MGSQRYGRRSAAIYRWLIDPIVRPLRPKITSLCLKHNIDHVLDIGCATGAQCRQLGVAGIRTVGLDLSEAMIAEAARRPDRNVEYIVASALELPFEPGSFDAAILSLALHEHSEQERTLMLQESLRVIMPNGFLILAEYSRPSKALLHVPWRVIQLIENLAGKEHRTGFRQFVATDGMRGLLDRHGLKPIEFISSHFGTLLIGIAHPPGLHVADSLKQEILREQLLDEL